MTDIHPDWNREKAEAHLVDLDKQATTAHAIYEAMTEAAERHLRDALRYENQAAHCRLMFSNPKTEGEAV